MFGLQKIANLVIRLGFTLAMTIVAVFLNPITSSAETINTDINPTEISRSAAASAGSVNSGSLLPDTFTGSLSYSIPISVTQGRHGMTPTLALRYKSTNGNAWVGVGWELDAGAIERNTRFGIDYASDNYQIRSNGSVIELVGIGANEYRAKMEGGFSRIKKLTATDGNTYWEVTDKNGTRFIYGQTSGSRQGDPDDISRIFKWCLELVVDTNGNFITFSYFKDNGQIYLDRIDYTGNGALAPSNYVKFNLEARNDADDSYALNFKSRMAYRMKTIDVFANAERVKKYELVYRPYSLNTGRSLLDKVVEYGKDGVQILSSIDLGWLEEAGQWSTVNTALLANGADQKGYGNFDQDNWQTIRFTDVNGDGMQDACVRHDYGLQCYLGTGDGFVYSAGYDSYTTGQFIFKNGYDQKGYSNFDGDNWQTLQFPDVNGDGKADACIRNDSGLQCYLSTGTGWEYSQGYDSYTTGQFIFKNGYDQKGYGNFDGDNWQTLQFPDVNGDGKADACIRNDFGLQCYLSTGTGWEYSQSYDSYATGQFIFKNGYDQKNFGAFDGDNWQTLRFVDVNSDGKADACIRNDYGLQCYLSTGSGWLYSQGYDSHATGQFIFKNGTDQKGYGTFDGDNWQTIRFADVNGDGKADACIRNDSGLQCFLSTGTGWAYSQSYDSYATGQFIFKNGTDQKGYGTFDGDNWQTLRIMDINGDGKADACVRQDYGMQCYLSTGNGWQYSADYDTYATNKLLFKNEAGFDFDNYYTLQFADVQGNGRNVPCARKDSGIVCGNLGDQYKPQTDLLNSISNGLGGTTTVSYAPSTTYLNTQLPFPVQTVSSVTVNDANGNLSTNNYTYSGGFYHLGERDFRGFNYAKVTGPAGPSGEQTITETWFHQGNDTAVDINDPNVPVGYMKGKPYRQRMSDSQARLLSETTTSYAQDADNATPWNNPPLQVDSSFFDGSPTAKQTSVVYSYDEYGNVIYEYQYGDLSDSLDDRTIARTFSPNIVKWLVGLPTSETIVKGIQSPIQVAKTDFYYDSVLDCSTASTNQTPDKGNLTRVVKWLNGGASPEVRMAYDGYGNLACTRDAKGNTSFVSYDSSYTFPTVTTNPLGFQTVTKYYGVDGVLADKGLYGQLKSITDANGAVATHEYDIFGRKTKETLPDNSWTNQSYNSFGSVGSQNVRIETSEGIWSENYFDGSGRTVRERRKGPDGKNIVSETQYDNRGAVTRSSLPYFEALETPRNKTFVYDPIGRVIQATNPDTTRVLACFDKDVTVRIDSNNHRKRETHDASGHLVKVEEYKGIYDSCTTDVGTPYATTTYQYDVLGNLLFVTDAKNQASLQYQTEMRYDTLGRKTFMHDPDMGDWNYTYYPDGSLETQTDAKGQRIAFYYDQLGRVQKKDYADPAFTDINYTYDEPTSTYAKGRLTTMTDASGSTKYFYDKLGRTEKTIKNIDGTSYTIMFGYDGLGRIKSITYPDNETLIYAYDTGGNLYQAGSYATYTNYNALGQSGTVTFGNGVSTVYQYYPANNRLYSITTNSPTQGGLVNLSYAYDNKGNITSTTDLLNVIVPQTVRYDTVAYTPYAGKPHALGTTSSGRNYVYDANGNMTTDGERNIIYDYDNMPQTISGSIETVNFIYDGNGSRVKKITPTATRLYIDKLYECVSGVCGKYIFAGNNRIALKSATKTLYYHADHQGSTIAITNANGNKEEDVAYYPFGETRSEAGTEPVNHKYTGQEFDTEMGLYNYNARVYAPEIGKFISPDSVVQDYSDPQTLNRYNYARNNPVLYIDSDGHIFGIDDLLAAIIVGAVVGTVSSGVQSDWDFKATITGAAIGAVSGAVGYGAGSWASGAIGGGTTGGIVGGAVGGAAAGASSGGLYATIYGGNIFDGMLKGAGYGALGGAIFGAIGSYFGQDWDLWRIGISTLAGGGIAEIIGGDFTEGALFAFGASATAYAYNKFVGYGAVWEKGGKAVEKRPDSYPYKGANNIGTQGGPVDPNGWWSEGGRISRFANLIPGVNAVAGLHDVFQVNLDIFGGAIARNVLNVPGMIPAAALTYAALMTDIRAVIIYTATQARDRAN